MVVPLLHREMSSASKRVDMVENDNHNNHYIYYEPKQLQKPTQLEQQEQSEDNESTTTYNSRKWEDHDSIVGGGSVDVQQQQQHDVALSILSLQPVSMPMIAAVLLLESPQHLDAAAAIVSATATKLEKNTAKSTRISATQNNHTENKWKKALNWNSTIATTNTPAVNNKKGSSSNKSTYLQGKSHESATITSTSTPCYKRATCNYVYLLPRSWVISWICWAYNQICTLEELPHKKPLFMELCQLLQLDTNSVIMECFNNNSANADPSTSSQHHYNTIYSLPGPMDASPLSLMGHPLLLKPNIFFGKGTVPDSLPTITSTHHISSSTNTTYNMQQLNNHQQKQQQRGRSKTKQESTSKIRRSSSLSGLSKLVLEAGVPKVSTTANNAHYHLLNSTIVGCCAISESFYDYIKSIHGVRCNDFKTVSFQSSSHGSSSSASSNTGSNTEDILYHHIKTQQGKNNKNSLNHRSLSTNDTNRSSSLFLSSSKKFLVAQTSRRHSRYDSKGVMQERVEPKPIEFKRRVIHGIPDIFDPSVMRSIVEIYPIKFLYTVIEPTSSSATNSTTNTNNYTLHSHTGGSTTNDAGKKTYSATLPNLATTKYENVLKRSMSDTITTRSSKPAEDNASHVVLSQHPASKTASSQITYLNILQTAATKLLHDKTNTANNTTTATATTAVPSVERCAPDVDDSETLQKNSKFNEPISKDSAENLGNKNIVQQSTSNSPKFYDSNHNSKAASSVVTASGFALISRATPIDQAIKAVLHVVAADKSADCKRCWISYSFEDSSTSGRMNGKDTNKQKQYFPLGVKDASSHYSREAADTKNRSFNQQHEETRESLSSSSTCPTLSSLKRNFASAREARGILGTEFGDGYELWTDLFNSNNHQQLSVEDFLQQCNVENVKISPSSSFITTNLQQVKCNIIIETRNNSLKDCYTRQHLELCNRIQVGDFIDAPDKCGKWYEAIVREETEDLVKVHYIGWGSRWDAWIRRFDQSCYPTDFQHLPGPPAPLWSRSSRWRCNAKVGSDVEVREAASLAVRPKWFPAKIVALGRESDPIRSCEGGAQLEALEPDDDDPENPISLLLLHRTRQVLVEVPKENFNSHVRAKLLPTTALLESDDPTPNPPYIRWVNLYGEEICNQYTHNAAPTSGVEEVAPVTIRYDCEASRKPVEVLQTFNNVYGAGFVRESIRGVPPAPGSVGLHNLGNSCFLNSILQCLNHIAPLTQFFLSGAYKTDINKKNPLGSGGIVARAYASLLNDMWSGEYSTLAPRVLKTTVAQFAPQFNNCLQHDSQEFCSFLMDGLHEDLNRVIDKPYIEEMEGRGLKDDVVAMESWRRHLLRHDSVIVDHCQGMHRSHLTCPECGHESVKFDVYSTISLPIPEVEGMKTIPLSASLASFTSVEELDEENAWYCNQCQKHVCAKKRISLWSTPDILILHLKRFTFNKCKKVEGRILRSKVETKVEFPVDGLNMSPYIIGPIDEECLPIYNLFGVSEHQGSTSNSGHYTATVRNSRDGNWYRYNDSHVGRTSGDASITGGAYVLFYQRQKGKHRWAGMEKELLRKNKSSSLGTDADGFQEVKSKKSRRKKGM